MLTFKARSRAGMSSAHQIRTLKSVEVELRLKKRAKEKMLFFSICQQKIKKSHLNVALLMSAAQFSSKMLKRLKQQEFCRKV